MQDLTPFLGVNHKIFESLKLHYHKKWDRKFILDSGFAIKEINQQKVAIVGVGKIGTEIAKLLKKFGFHTIGCTNKYRKRLLYIDKVYSKERITTMLKQADFIVLSLPLNRNTTGLISKKELGVLKNNCFIINVSRDGIFNKGAIIDALKKNSLRGISLDVLENEPPHDNDPYYNLENFYITPHIAVASENYWLRAIRLFEHNVMCHFLNKPKKNLVRSSLE